jgi:FKBP-type peptidyl-prolyl cis-trans isomerase
VAAVNNTSTIWKHGQTAGALALACLLAACGSGASDSGASKAQVTLASVTTQQLDASAYVDVVQKIYIAYFGRPADAGGLASFSGQLAAVNAPTEISQLASAYNTNASLRALIDGFSGSTESAALYPGDTRDFVLAVYDHLLNRAPADTGLAFWVNAIDSGTLNKSLASLSITAAALANTTEQGKKDAALINIKSAVANSFTTTLAGTSVYAGRDAAALARTMLAGLSANSTQADFQAVLDAVTADMKAGSQAAKPYPLLLSYISFLSRGQASQSAVVSGTCSGYASGSTTIPAPVTFEGKAALSATAANIMRFSNCSPSSLSSTTVQYFNANYTPVGSEDPGYEYTVFTTAAQPLPVRVAVGDSGSYGVQTVYANSTKQSVTGRRELSYTIEADAASATPASAIFNLKMLSYDAGNVLQFTRQSRYRVAVDGSVTPVSEDEQYSGGSTVHLLSKAQPTALKMTDSVTGSGTLAVNGKTLTVNYTGWLYDAGAPNFHGAQFDSSVGRTPFSFVLGAGRVIGGWEQGFAGMKVGGKRTLIIPSALGYGNYGSGSIPPGAGLVFDVELVAVN